MYKYIYTVLILIFIGFKSNSQIILHISEVPNDTPETDTLYLSSDINDWNENDINYAFSKDINGNYKLILSDIGLPFEFKITRGGWNNVETDINANRTENRVINSIDSISEIVILGWHDHLYKEENTLSKNVKILDSSFYMPQLDRTRRIWIYLPESYSDSEKSYPVIYMHDGQNLFNNSTSFAGEWNVDETMDSLITAGNKEAIIIGIDNGGEYRIDELTPFSNNEYGGGNGSKYLEFIVKTLKPYIDNNYRTLSDRNNTAIMGSSLGGLISFYAILKYKKVFSKAGVMSPSFWFSNNIYFIPGYRDNYPMKIYFEAGDRERDNMVLNIEKMISKMKKMNFPDNSYKLKVVKGAKHNEKQWRSEFADAYIWLME